MRRARALVVAVTVAGLGALVACRGILGIEGLEVEEAGADAAPSGENDTGAPSHDSGVDSGNPGTDAGHDSGPPPPPQDSGCASSVNPPCQPCCRMAFPPGYVQMQQAAIAGGCICAGGANDCTTDCASTVCLDAAAPPASSCAMCLDQQLASAACQGALSSCTSQSCNGARGCLLSCQ